LASSSPRLLLLSWKKAMAGLRANARRIIIAGGLSTARRLSPHKTALHVAVTRKDDDDSRCKRQQATVVLGTTRSVVYHGFHTTARHEDPFLAAAGLTVAAVGYGGNLALRSLERYQRENPPVEDPPSAENDEAEAGRANAENSAEEEPGGTAEANADGKTDGGGAEAESNASGSKEKGKPAAEDVDLDKLFEQFKTTISEIKMPKASDFTGAAAGARYYSGGFGEKMSRREAAQILGVRESAEAKRIKDSHRRILMANHPDKGGSPYMAAKINEAKELLLKGRGK
jgi:DnaJ family protein C protein 19